ncbi:MAG TPA: FdtA/QdtA family cupin domain-containing protein [Bryobacteraceae bacterium]|nr:FdtA/QdtA family cupin domain-containing protein [Bryobacteraceae bacterium]
MIETRGLCREVDRTQERQARLIGVPSFSDHRGTLCVLDWKKELPFTPERLYYIHGVTEGAKRAGHAHFREVELILCLAGSIRVVIDNGRSREEFLLDRPDLGLYIPRMLWHELDAFSPGALCAVLATGHHSEDDYCRDYHEFLQHTAG